MSAFDQQMGQASEPLMGQLADSIPYWPGGDSDSAVSILTIFTPGMLREMGDDDVRHEIQDAEAVIYADDLDGIAAPVVLKDIIVQGGKQWRVMEIIETVGGIHRLSCQWSNRSRVGRGRA